MGLVHAIEPHDLSTEARLPLRGDASGACEQILQDTGVERMPWFSVFNMASAAIGAGVLAFPFAYRQAGALGGFLVTITIAFVEITALCILVRAAEKHSARTYQDLVHRALGPVASAVVAAASFTYCFGSCIAYLIIVADVFQPAVASVVGEGSVLAARSVVLCAISVLVVLPLAWQRTLRSLRFSSALSFFSLLYLAAEILVCGTVRLVERRGVPEGVELFGTSAKSYFSAMDIIVFAFHCHIQVVPIFAELCDYQATLSSSQEPPSQSSVLKMGRPGAVRAMDQVVLVALGTCLVAYSLVGEFGYLAFPDVKSDILSSFSSGNKATGIARFGMGLVAVVAYPINHFPARLVAESAVSKFRPNRSPGISHAVLTIAYLAGTLSIALVVLELGKVYEVVGSTSGVTVIFFIPGLLLLRGLMGEGEDEPAEVSLERGRRRLGWGLWQQFGLRIGALVMLGMGLVIFLYTIVSTFNGAG